MPAAPYSAHEIEKADFRVCVLRHRSRAIMNDTHANERASTAHAIAFSGPGGCTMNVRMIPPVHASRITSINTPGAAERHVIGGGGIASSCPPGSSRRGGGGPPLSGNSSHKTPGGSSGVGVLSLLPYSAGGGACPMT